MESYVDKLKPSVNELVRHGYDAKRIFHRLVSTYSEEPGFEMSSFKKIVEAIAKEHPHYETYRLLERSYLVLDMKTSELKIIDNINKAHIPISRETLNTVVHKKYDMSNKIVPCEFIYEPNTNKVLIKTNTGVQKYNTYIPPKWYEDYYYSEGTININKNSTLPDMYYKFLNHLTNGHEASREYILDWLANGIRSRNFCVLTTIGAPGIGKGVLAEIMRVIFGQTNFYAGSDRMFKGQFNSQIANRKLVYCDEVSIKDKEQEDKLKMVINDFIEVEKKGVDAGELRNHANFYLSSNNMDSIKISADDRRFSIVELTSDKLINAMSISEIEALTSEENVEELCKYLYYREYDRTLMMRPFVSARTHRIREYALNAWQEYFLFTFCPKNAGRMLDLRHISAAISEELESAKRVGRPAMEQLQEYYPGFFKLRCIKSDDGARKWSIQISEEDKLKVLLNKGSV